MRKAFELVKLRAAARIPGAKIVFDRDMPVRKVLVKGEPAFIQRKESMRRSFVGASFESMTLPA